MSQGVPSLRGLDFVEDEPEVRKQHFEPCGLQLAGARTRAWALPPWRGWAAPGTAVILEGLGGPETDRPWGRVQPGLAFAHHNPVSGIHSELVCTPCWSPGITPQSGLADRPHFSRLWVYGLCVVSTAEPVALGHDHKYLKTQS